MASRWFVFWIALFIVCALDNEPGLALLFLILAAITSEAKIKRSDQ